MRFLFALALVLFFPLGAGAQSLPLSLTPMELQSRESETYNEGVPAGIAVVEGPRGPTYQSHRLPGSQFRHSLGIYVSEKTVHYLRFQVFYQTPEHRPFAERAGRLLGLLWGLADRRFASTVARLRDSPVSVWMTREGDPGAEQHAANLFLYNVLSPRSGIEWIRELAHEYGHYLLPGATGYTEPESWSHGMLGERLFIHWLYQEAIAGRVTQESLAFAASKDLKLYCDRQVFPLLDPVRARGPDPAVLSGSDERALDAHTALMLYIDAIYGSRALVQLIEYLPPGRMRAPQGIDFLVAFITWTREEPIQTISLSASRVSMIYLSRGEFGITQESGPKGRLNINGSPVQGADGDWTIRVPIAGWRTITLSDSKGPATLRLQRRGSG